MNTLDLQSRLASAVRDAVRSLFGTDLADVAFQYPPRIELGDLALTAPFDLARNLRRKPREIAESLAGALASAPGVQRAEVAGGGYVNLFLHRGAFAREIHEGLASPPAPPSRDGVVIVEHTSINPNKAAHIGHLRNATLGDTFVHVLRHRGYHVGVQNYIDDTGVQLADVVVGFLHVEGLARADVEGISGRFDFHCWDLYARVGDFYAADPARRALQAQVLHEVEAGDNETARLGAYVAARIVDCHLLTMERLGIRYDLLARESDILRLHFWDRAFVLLKEAGAIRLETEGKSMGCWVLSMDPTGAATQSDEKEPRSEARFTRAKRSRGDRGGATQHPPDEKDQRSGGDEDKILVRSNGTVTYTGKDIAYQLWKLGRLDRDFHYQRHRVYSDGHVLWTTTSAEGEPGAPVFGHARAVYNVIDVGQSYPQRVVRAGVAALGHTAGAEGSHHLGYEKVVLSPATARALGYSVADSETVVKVSGRKGLGVKADDLIDALVAKALTEIGTRDEGQRREAAEIDATARAISVGALRYFLLKYGRTKVITFDMDEALAFVGETGPYVQNAVVRARNILAKLAAEGHDVAALRQRGQDLDWDPFLTGEEGDEVWALLLLMARSEEAAEQAVRAEEVALLAKHTFFVAQAFHSYYQKPRYSVLYAASEDLRALRTCVVFSFVRQMEVLMGLLGIPIPDRM